MKSSVFVPSCLVSVQYSLSSLLCWRSVIFGSSAAKCSSTFTFGAEQEVCGGVLDLFRRKLLQTKTVL